MLNKGLILVVLLFSSLFIGGKKIKTECFDCDKKVRDSIIWAKSTIYLESLRREAVKVVINKKLQVDSLGNVIEVKDKTIKFQKKQINNLKEDLKEKPKEIIIRDTIVVETKKSFWGKTKTDTLKR
jgi:hypothetical protein